MKWRNGEGFGSNEELRKREKGAKETNVPM